MCPSFGPDITAISADAAIASAAKAKYGSSARSAPPVFAATHVIDEADRLGLQVGPDTEPQQCTGGDQEDERADFDPRAADQFRLQRSLVNGKFFLFKINSAGKYQLIPG